MVLLLALPIWIPLIFLSYFLGRKQFSLRFLFLLITLEAISFGCVLLSISEAYSLPLSETNKLAPSFFAVFTLASLVFTCPLGAPLILTAYAFGIKRFDSGFWFYLIVVEMMCLVLCCGALPSI
jgi:hypothetical protein